MSKPERYSEIIEICLKHAQERDYKSDDVSDLLKTRYYSFGNSLPSSLLQKIVLKPYFDLIRHKPDLIRRFVKEKGFVYPQGQAMVIRALVALAKNGSPLGDISEAERIASWLIENSSPLTEHFGWGQPFLWYSRKPFPAHTPRATVSSQVAWAMLDLHEYTNNEKYLDVVKSVWNLFRDDFNYTPDKKGNFCLSYTTIDNYHIHNSSMLAASVLMRLFKITGDEEIGNFAKKLINFTVSHQNEDGSFYYWAPPDKLNYKIDNYHTGFVLESFRTIIDDFDNNSYKNAYETGIEYYFDNLFDGATPKFTNKETFPIDIQSCAQSMMTFWMDGRNGKYADKAYEIADYAIERFFVKEKNHFGYRIFKDGKRDDSYYFRWGDAWMIRALAYLSN